jgi:putative ABC transport system substrate-binding protein
VLVVAATPGSVAAKAATRTIPIVIVAVADPVKSGLVANIARPGGNITGLSLLTPELSGKRLELLASVAGAIPRVGALLNPRNASHAIFLEETRSAAQRLGVELDRAFSMLIASRGAALIVFDDPVLWSHRPQIVALAASRRVPVMYGYREYVDEGGLISYGPDRIDLYKRTAGYVDKILKGARPAELPVEQPTKFELVINLRTAKSLKLVVPQSLLISADKVIE